ncbi:MAG: galactokinase [Firmicutes bacterium]|nr:galactokinase [Bacillota bacterium]
MEKNHLQRYAGKYETDNAARIQGVRDVFKKTFGAGAEAIFSSPGRIEILGNHTDHNGGKVLTGAINRDTLAAVSPYSRVEIVSESYEDIWLDAGDTNLNAVERGRSSALVKGVIRGFLDRGLRVGGFRAALTSNIFKGAGVSSSASYELLIAQILNALYNDGAVDAVTLAKIAQFAENEYFGKPCGMLDQSAIALGGVTKIDFKSEPVFETITGPLSGYDIIVTNTGGDHAGLTGEYASIREEMAAVAKEFGAFRLRDVDPEKVFQNAAAIGEKLGDRAVLRALHFFDENERVDAAARAYRAGDAKIFLDCVRASGESSYMLLQNCFVPGRTSQPVPIALALSVRLCPRGAFRVHGGGFAGTILGFVPSADSARYLEAMAAAFGKENAFAASVRPIGVTRIE